MAKSQNQKAKVLYLERMMRETGENHVVSMQEILAKLLEYGICAERKSIYDDFEALRSFGMDVRYKRGKNGGYYLAGQIVSEDVIAKYAESVNTSEQTIAEKQENVCEQKKPGENWEFGKAGINSDSSGAERSGDADGEKKQMKLHFPKDKESEVRAYFGNVENCKEKGEDIMTGCVEYVSDPQFFGWLTAMGKDVKILKPKKLAQSYREYLKNIVKAYK